MIWRTAIATIALFCLPFASRAQAQLMQRGQPFPFLRGAAIELPVYEQLRLKMAQADSVIASKNRRIDQLMLQVHFSQGALAHQKVSYSTALGTIERKNLYIVDLDTRHAQVLREWEPKKPFFRRPSFWISTGLGLVGGAMGTAKFFCPKFL